MKALRENIWIKVLAWVVLLCAAFGTGVFGVRTVLAMQAVMSDSWQGSSRYHSALYSRRETLAEAIQLVLQIRELEEQIAQGEASTLLSADLEALREQREEMERYFGRDATWFRFRVLSADSRLVLGSNLLEGEAMVKAVEEVYRFTLDLTELGEGWAGDGYYAQFETLTGGSEADQNGAEVPSVRLVVEYGVPGELDDSIQDEFWRARQVYEADRAGFDTHLTGLLNLGALTLIALVWVLWSAGHKKGGEGVALTWQEHIFFDVYAVGMTGVGVLCLFGGVWAAEQTYLHSVRSSSWMLAEGMEPYAPLGVMGSAALFAGVAAAAALLLRTLVVRIKARCLARTTLLCRVWTWTVRTVHEFIRSLPVTWKAVLGFGCYVAVTFWLAIYGHYDGFFLLVYLVIQLAALLFLGWWTLSYCRLRQGTRTIARGDLEYQVDARHMPYDLRLQAEDLNNISAGLSEAVEERMRSERFKAELITNVSHDLKTPLTSIINYVNLLKSTRQTDPKAEEYIEVLERKSQRLKKLTEDLVEASKASTGALRVNRERIDAGQLIDQALGEWEEKLAGRQLTVVTTLPEGETWVYADGRHLWRVIDNLLSNCAKYAMEGTRVYLDLVRGRGQVAVSVKNISREPLNVPPERLMERFVRGEESRSTEGSGLGLSIARSLTELQGGTFELVVDGDLFKAIVTLPQAS